MLMTQMDLNIKMLSREIKGLHVEMAALKDVIKEQNNTIRLFVANQPKPQVDLLTFVPNPRQDGLEERISKILLGLKIPPNVKGYLFLKEAVAMVYNGFQISGSVTKVLYPTIAQRYNTAPNRVERGIRHAIEISWIKTNHATITDLMERPTNSAFIALVAEKLRLEDSSSEE